MTLAETLMMKLAPAICLLVCTAGAQTWVKSPVNGHYYASTLGTKSTWKQANAEAVKHGALLATIRNQKENDWAYKAFGTGVAVLWIGLTDEAKEGTWVWVSKEKTTFFPWAPGQPDNRFGREDYCYITGGTGHPSGKWADGGYRVGLAMKGLMERKTAPTFASWVNIAKGCPTSKNSIPSLKALTLPLIGKSLSFQLSNASISSYPISVAALFFGFTPTSIDLKPFGAPGCTAIANPHISMLLQTDFNGAWKSAPFPIPKDTRLLGAVFYNQVFVYDPKANKLMLVASNGAKGMIGY